MDMAMDMDMDMDMATVTDTVTDMDTGIAMDPIQVMAPMAMKLKNTRNHSGNELSVYKIPLSRGGRRPGWFFMLPLKTHGRVSLHVYLYFYGI